MRATAFINDYNKSKKKIDQECMDKIRGLFSTYIRSNYNYALKVLEECPDVINTESYAFARLDLYVLCKKTDYSKHRIKYSFTNAMEIIHKTCCPEYFNLFILKNSMTRNGIDYEFLKQFEHCSFYDELTKNMVSDEYYMDTYFADFFDKHVQILIFTRQHRYSTIVGLKELSAWEKLIDYKDPKIVELYRHSIDKYGDLFVEKIILYIFRGGGGSDYKNYIELLARTGNKLCFQKCIDVLLKNKKYHQIELVYKYFNKPLNFNDFSNLSDETVYQIVFNNFTFTDNDKQKLNYYNKERGLAFVVYYSFVLEKTPFFGEQSIKYFVSEIDWDYKLPSIELDDIQYKGNFNHREQIPEFPVKNLGELICWMIDNQVSSGGRLFQNFFNEFYCKKRDSIILET